MVRTQRGRVVYDRPRHFFQGRDLIRIARALPPPESVNEIAERLVILSEVFFDLVTAAVHMFDFFGVSVVAEILVPFFGRIVQELLLAQSLSEAARARLRKIALSLL